MTGSYDNAPNAAPVLTDQEWKRCRLMGYLVGRGDFREDIGADFEPYVCVRDLIRRGSFDPAQSGSA